MAVKKLAEHEIRFLLTAQNKTKTVFGSIKKSLPDIKHLAAATGAALTAMGVAATTAAGLSVNAFANFEEALVDVGRVTDQSLGEVKKQILALPPVLGSATDLVRGYYNVISAGVTEPKAALDLLTTAAKASKAGHLDLKETVAGLTNIMDGMKGSFTSATEAADKLFTIERIGKVEFQNLIPVIGQVASSANLLNVSVDELGGLLATVSKTAGSTEAAATAVKASFAALLKPSADMTKALKNMGFSSGAAAIESLGLERTLKGLNKQIQAGTFSAAELFSKQRALVGIGPSLKDNFAALGKNVEEMGKSTGATDAAFEKWSNTLKGLWDTFKNTIGRIAIRIGEELAPDIKQALTDIGGWLDDNSDEIVDWVRVFIEGFKGVIKVLGPFKDAVIAAFNFLKDNVPPLVKPIITSLIEFKDGLLGVQEQAEKTKDGTKKSFDELNKLKVDPPDVKKLTEGVDPSAPLFTRLGQLFATLGDTLGSAFFKLEEALESAKVKFWSWVGEMLKGVGDFVADVIIEFEKMHGFDFGAVLFPIEDVKSKSSAIQAELEGVTGSAEKMNESLNKEMEVSIDGDPAIKTLEDLSAKASELQTEFSDMALKVTVSKEGILEFTNIKKDLQDPSWSAALTKNFNIKTKTAEQTITKMRVTLDNLPSEKTTTLKADITDVQVKTKEVTKMVTATAEEFIKANEALLKPFRDTLGQLPKELTSALDQGKKVIITQGGFIIADVLKTMTEKVLADTPKVGEALLQSLDKALRENAQLPEGAIIDIMGSMIDLMETDQELFKKTGANILKSITEGVDAGAADLDKAMSTVIQENVADYLPQSPAKKGPLSNLDLVGGTIINTVADGITASAGSLNIAMTDALGGVIDALEGLTQKASNIPPITISTNIEQILDDIKQIPAELDKLPDDIVKTVTIQTEDAVIEISKVAVALNEIPADNIKKLSIDNASAILSIQEVIDSLAAIPDPTEILIDILTDAAHESIEAVIKSLALVPDVTRTLSINNTPAILAIGEVLSRLNDIPEITTKTLIMKVETEASPRQPFSQGMDSIEARIKGLPGRRDLVIDTEVPRAIGGAGFKPQRQEPQINQSVNITVNIQASEIAEGNVEELSDKIGQSIARKLNTHRATDLRDAITRIR